MGSGAAGSEAVGRARVHRGGAADDRPRRDHRQHCAAVGAGSPRRLRRRPAMGRHRLHACLRRPAAPGWPDRRLPGAQAGLHDRPGRLCPGLPGWRRGAELRRPGRRPRGAGRVRGAACAHRSCSACNLVHRGPRARHRVRGVRIDRRQRSGDRDAARRGADPVPLLAMVPLRQPARRHRRRDRRLDRPACVIGSGPAISGRARCGACRGGAGLARVRNYRSGQVRQR